MSALAVFATLGLLAAATVQGASAKNSKSAPSMPLSQRDRVVHALNRLTFGPRPGDVDRVMAQGLDKWIDQQLHPEHISDAQLDARLAAFPTLKMSPKQMVENFPPPQVIKAIANGRMSLPSDPEKRARYEQELQRYERRQARKQDSQSPNAEPQQDRAMPQDSASISNEKNDEREDVTTLSHSFMNMPEEDRAQALQQMDPATRRAVVLSLGPAQREQLLGSLSSQQRHGIRELPGPQEVVVEAGEAKLLRSVYSERQFEEVLTDFWFNHFNVFIGKGADRYLVTSYERDVIRPHVFGKFKDLLVATAKSPAMLFYLDNWQSVGPNSPAALGQGFRRQQVRGPFGRRFPVQRRFPAQQQAQKKQPQRGLNENYGRELMELHTLGVDGGYTQKDVTEVARVFTGWTLDRPRQGGGFIFRPAMHDPGTKVVLGKRIKENGEKEGTEVLDMLARRPATAKFVSTKLAERFVADDPPPALVARMAQTFMKTDGDLREVYRTMLRSPEFWDANVYRAKVKTPLEFVASAIRASGAQIENPMPLVRQLNAMGMPLYGAQPPTGYSPQAESWVNSAALLARMNFALGLASGRLPGVTFDPGLVLNATASEHENDEQVLDQLGTKLLDGALSAQTKQTIENQVQNPDNATTGLPNADNPRAVNLMTGLLLGSPDFQRR
jgi:uncharacterized protein (DUF1800 family)